MSPSISISLILLEFSESYRSGNLPLAVSQSAHITPPRAIIALIQGVHETEARPQSGN
jgi:hypothetical protein